MRFLAGFIIGAIACVGTPLLALGLGLVDMSAVSKPGAIESFIGNLAYDSWIRRNAPPQANPFDGSPAAVATGLNHYRENCIGCHGAVDIEPDELARGLHPDAPELQKEDSQRMTDGEIFWTVRQGVRMTGMPGFAPTHSDEEIWKIVAFVRHLPHLTPEERAQLRSAMQAENHHHEDH